MVVALQTLRDLIEHRERTAEQSIEAEPSGIG